MAVGSGDGVVGFSPSVAAAGNRAYNRLCLPSRAGPPRSQAISHSMVSSMNASGDRVALAAAGEREVAFLLQVDSFTAYLAPRVLSGIGAWERAPLLHQAPSADRTGRAPRKKGQPGG